MTKEQTALLTAFYATLPVRVRSYLLDVLGSRIESDEEWAGEEDFLTSPQHVTICAMADALIADLGRPPRVVRFDLRSARKRALEADIFIHDEIVVEGIGVLTRGLELNGPEENQGQAGPAESARRINERLASSRCIMRWEVE